MTVERELFDMQADPHEFNNLADNPKYAKQIATLHQRMVEEVVGDPDVTEKRAVQQLAAGYPGAPPDDGKDPGE